MKAEAVREVKLHPVVFQMYFAVGVCLSSSPVMLLSSWSMSRFTCWAFLSAFMGAIANMICVLVVDLLGVSVGQGLWSGSVALVAFIDGLIEGQKLGNTFLAAVGMSLLIFGIVGLAVTSGGTSNDDKEAKVAVAQQDVSAVDAEAALLGKQQSERSPARTIQGVLLALCVGILAGSMFVPLKEFTDLEGENQILYSVPFGVGAMLSALALLFVHQLLQIFGVLAPLRWELRRCFLPGLVSGVLWNFGNMCSIFAMLPPLGMAIGYPLTQSCILVSGLWGIAYYKEIKGIRAVSRFFAFASVLLTGAAVLGVFGA
eukprot:gnl/TRDRNA2_/TRDRNA2_199088_c0_seq1.p1 gnl/TRDRNA2_/TRDRNA2_199088_c0~~gnl/TRDRNA2_/TRDRNA2_199088_c0_seq1.p1  ORF type:complete len:354 (+),score=66.23 gnl/TRDRNA2_/TRDRNA2_199088_c0_seq1:118-1062(+)